MKRSTLNGNKADIDSFNGSIGGQDNGNYDGNNGAGDIGDINQGSNNRGNVGNGNSFEFPSTGSSSGRTCM